jgi:hypothetical protein
MVRVRVRARVRVRVRARVRVRVRVSTELLSNPRTASASRYTPTDTQGYVMLCYGAPSTHPSAP